jgi:penicillin-binding protein 1B
MNRSQIALNVVRRWPRASAVLLLLLVTIGWLSYLDFVVTRKFDGRRWDLPAQVYARPLEIYAGLALTRERLEQELLRLGYQRVSFVPRRPATFRPMRRGIELITRDFRFWDGRQPPLRLTIEFAGARVAGLASTGGDLPLARLDPLLVGSIFPSHGEDRMIAAPDDTPRILVAALKAVEDRRFDVHHGVDPVALARAMLFNLRNGKILQGGSTLTQQLVKNYFLDNRRTLWRKVQEAAMAMILESHYDKPDLLNAYINEIYMGQDGDRAVHGFGLASQFYFSRPLDELELHQIALLVAMVKGPAYYDPDRHPERALERRNLVLEILADNGVISATEATEASHRRLDTWDRQRDGSSYYPAFLQLVRTQLAEQYREEDLTSHGLRVFTALDPLVQSVAEAELRAGLARLDQRNAATDVALAGAAVVTSAQSGEVLAIVGDRRAGFDGFNRALNARRPIGSLVKPFVYLAALQSGSYHIASLVEDEPIIVTLDNGDTWAPQNYDGETHGTVTLLRALTESFNLATVRVGLDVGPVRVADTITAAGGPAGIAPYPSLLLGAVEMTPLEVAQIYGTLANGGFRTPLRAVRSVVAADGAPLASYPMAITQVVPPGAVYPLNQALVQVLQRGTGRSARAQLPAGFTAAGKTGTSDAYRDSWFAGFTGEHVLVVWIGYDDNRPTGLTGATGALQIWAAMLRDMPSAPYGPPPPAELDNQWIDYDTGLLARPACADVVELALPREAQLGSKPGCGPGLRRLGQRTRQWLEEVLN